MQAPTKPCRAEACRRATECEAFMESSMKRTESIPALSRLALTRRQMLLRNVIGLGRNPDVCRVSTGTLKLFESLGRGEPGDWLFPSNKRNGPLTRQAVAARMAMWGQEANVRLHPHRCRHTHATHAIRRGVDVFTLSATLGHSSTGTTSHYVLAEPGESSSLKLG